MASVNKAILIGNLGKDPEVRYMPDGKSVANITVATSEKWKDKTGEKQERTEWHNVTFYSPLADIVGKYLRKGSSVFVEGRLQTRKWQDKNGQDRYTTEIIANEMKMLGGRGEHGGGEHGGSGNDDNHKQDNHRGYYQPPITQSARNQASMAAQAPGGFDDDIPW